MHQNINSRTVFSPVRLTVFIMLSLTVMGVIFMFSSQDSDESGAVSDFVSYIISKMLSPILPESVMDFILTYIRKIAHSTIYFLLGIFTGLSAAETSLKMRRLPLCLLAAWLICILYAVSDEFHQSFTPGRCQSPRDVMIDSAGALAAIAIAGVICWVKRRRHD